MLGDYRFILHAIWRLTGVSAQFSTTKAGLCGSQEGLDQAAWAFHLVCLLSLLLPDSPLPVLFSLQE